MSDYRAEFIVEAREHLSTIEGALLELERGVPDDQGTSLIASALRALHSLKGDSGFLGFVQIRTLTHTMESLLEGCRDEHRPPKKEIVDDLLAARDFLAALIEDLDQSQNVSIDAILARLHARIPPNARTQLWEISLEPETSSGREILVELLSRLERDLAPQRARITGVERLDLRSPLPSLLPLSIQFDSALDLSENSTWKPRLLGLDRSVALSWKSRDRSPISIDLTQLESDSKNSYQPFSIAKAMKQIEEEVEPIAATLLFEPRDLSVGLPQGPVLWQTSLPEGASLPLSLTSPGSLAVTQPTPTPTIMQDSRSPLPTEQTNQSSIAAPLPPMVREAVPAEPPIPLKPETTVLASTASHSLAATPSPVRETDKAEPTTPLTKSVVTSDGERIRSLRINVELLDRLMNLIGELTLIRNQAQVYFGDEEGESRIIIQRLNSVTSELQDTVLQTRMQPVGNLFGRFPRMVRDLAKQLGKEVEIETIGQDVELDKTVIERLSDPLTHLIRNSIDHGIEMPEAREAAGKTRSGKIVLSATPADGQVYIEIRDDGKGIDPSAVRAKAISMRLRTPAELERMNLRELYSLILLPGFSTAKQVTDVSGRGVGMDVVRTNVEELEGTLSIDSVWGKGTSMTLRVPLTLAIVPCLIVKNGEERFAVPQRELEEIVCIHPHGKLQLEQAFDTEVFRLREMLIPVVRLSEILSHPKPFDPDRKAAIMAKYEPSKLDPNRIEYILVLKSDGKRFGLLVDDVRGREEIVVKPMHSALKQIGIFSGATMMGDGRVALIVNVEGIIEHARCFAVEIEDRKEATARDPHEVHRVLLFEYGPDEQFAIPLIQIKRIELLDMKRVERVGERDFVTIDGKSTRILRLNDAIQVSRCTESSSMFLILPKFVPEPMGILANRIVDTESLAIQLQSSSEEPGVLGTALVRDRLSLFLNIQELREHLFGKQSSILEPPTCEQGGQPTCSITESPEVDANATHKRVLLVDDTPFFREVVKRYLIDLGIDIRTAEDGKQALKILSEEDFDLVVSDIEMPNMNGWEFCRTARSQGYKMPFVALTSLTKSEHEGQAKACGFDDFEEKLDHDRLRKKVHDWLGRSATTRETR